ncbi:ABC transporter permease [Brachybacterium sp. EF45031]|uniref:ABC transporter permease n=1 Tax=Brachybacterium sillae TaxID=2810536 RepID=UPI00217D41DA|nr:ABC transporter permease [Brachybacterium sillae]MCS6711539.1 ABC transporter permease [Brachybacterium sillae]
MTFLLQAIAWILDPTHWGGATGIGRALLQHLWYTALGVGLAALLAVPAGLFVGHTRRGRGLAVALTSGARAVPTLGLVTVLALWFGIGLTAPILAFIVLAVPSLLAGAYSACESVDDRVIDAARAQGMTEMQILRSVELPLGMPLLITGLRSATLQVVATAMLAAYVGNGGLGGYIFRGLKTGDYPLMLAGSLLVVLLAIILDLALLTLQRLADPQRRARADRTRRGPAQTATAEPSPTTPSGGTA